MGPVSLCVIATLRGSRSCSAFKSSVSWSISASLVSDLKIVDHVQLDGMNINIPPQGRPSPAHESHRREQPYPQQSTAVLFRQILIHNGKLTILPKDKTKVPLQFDLQQVTLRSAGTGRAMKYDASLTNPKPPGQIHALGEFGPWAADSPGDSPIKGEYTFDHADLGVFKGIAGILSSTGKFEGVLSSIKAKGQARVPDFRLTMANNPVPLNTEFEVLVDGTNGNTILQPVHAMLGSTKFQTSGGVIKHEGDKRRSIDLDVLMPKGNLVDVLRLAMKGSPFMQGQLYFEDAYRNPTAFRKGSGEAAAKRPISDHRRQIFEIHNTGRDRQVEPSRSGQSRKPGNR